jgi:hypothetical protein
LFKPLAANSARRICGSIAERSFAPKDRRRFRSKIGTDRTAGSIQRDRNAVTGERGDDSCLIANAVEFILSRAADVTIRIMSDGDRLVEQWLGTFKTHSKVGTVLLHSRDETVPAKTGTCEIPLLYNATEIRDAVFHWLDTSVASGVECQL